MIDFCSPYHTTEVGYNPSAGYILKEKQHCLYGLSTACLCTVVRYSLSSKRGGGQIYLYTYIRRERDKKKKRRREEIEARGGQKRDIEKRHTQRQKATKAKMAS